ncbi:MAG: 2-C-methyl-D-erythritol 4-phosphate cytidylyltransferase [Treponema sp.]|jgi:2-C-methyl-D-erythritol 4-phosphate cytidylyltransferase|nr:2-C-methyl-D-erythritol 4-phosphate cytidylyltransferase [Treponema sp.]
MAAEKLASVAAIICAAGNSSRMGGIKKEYQKLKGGATVLGSAVSAFTSVSSIGVIVIAIPKDTEDSARSALPTQLLITQTPKILFAAGGDTRQTSVFNALCVLAEYNPQYVLIHDGARPWITSFLIESVIKETKKHSAVIPLLPLTDTPKECNVPLHEFIQEPFKESIFIKNHLKRAFTGVAQTPQGFKYSEILNAHKKAALKREEFTDDAEIWGRFCGPVAVIPGDPENRKITFPEDFYQ